MSVSVTFYNNRSDTRDVNKNITQIGAVRSLDIWGECSVENPVIRVELDNNLVNCNYAYIADFGRYYYCDSPVIVDGSFMIIQMRVDVLKTFWNSFKGSQCIAERSSSNFDKMIPDNEHVLRADKNYQVRKFSNFVFQPNETGLHYVLNLQGRGVV